ncbi:hypothetical protein HID58_024226 [Brassica napus]|uniref:Uncharacterized protein n=1 Tax=Brassica napus TaxID=3708 RepID=A0ABQ8D4D0_BRANA|nr:hypothetical protein HID58_024226 [Brassica napus]
MGYKIYCRSPKDMKKAYGPHKGNRAACPIRETRRQGIEPRVEIWNIRETRVARLDLIATETQDRRDFSPTTLSSPELKYRQASDENLTVLHHSIFTAERSI